MSQLNTLWISWEHHRRTKEICDYLGVEMFVVTSSRPFFLRYPYLLWKTLSKLLSTRPSTLIVQNPSIVLTFIAVVGKPLFGYTLVVDAHNEAVQPYTHNSWLIRKVACLLMRLADITIVTNDYLIGIVEACGGTPLVLPDRIPVSRCNHTIELDHDTVNLILIATYAADEPIEEIIDAATSMKETIKLYVTGNFEKLDCHYREQLPDNIVFTGFLDEDDYWAYLNSADAIVDLTLKDNCLVCGAYEGVAVTTPLILSDNPATVQLFNKGAVYTDNSTDDIRRAFGELVAGHAKLSEEISCLADELTADWVSKAAGLKQIIS